MALRISIRGRLMLLAGLALLGVCALAALAFGSNRVNQHALTTLYDDDIESLVRLQRIEIDLLEVRYRAAGVLLDQMPVTGSLNHVRDMRRSVASLWSELEPRGARIFTHGDALEEFKQLQARWGLVDATLAKLEQGYVAKDNAVLSKVLEDDWAVLLKGTIKPLQALIPVTQKSAAVDYEAAVGKSRSLLGMGLAVALACLLGLSLVAWLTMRSLLRPLGEVEHSMRRIAEGDLSTPVPAPRHDELGRMVAALSEMQQRLKGLVSEVRESTGSIAAASAQIAAGSQDLSRRTEDTAASLQRTASSMEQLTSTVVQSADSARQANELATTAASVAERGGQVVAEVVATMDQITASSKKIADIVGVINGIAFQTNILALNAAVEAARAGTQGRGFAVVAGEVRSLAQRCAAAASEIKELIGSSVQQVESGSQLVADAGKTMSEIVGSVRHVTAIMGEIRVATSEQSEGIGHVNTAVYQLDQATQQNAALVEQSAAAAESLRDHAGRLAEVVSIFRLDEQVHAPEADPSFGSASAALPSISTT